VLIVVEGAKGLSLNCNNTPEGNVTLSSEKRTPLSKWNVRLGQEYVWTIRNTGIEENYYYTPYLSCVAKDKNGEIKFDHFIS
jgi:hypothetical protein